MFRISTESIFNLPAVDSFVKNALFQVHNEDGVNYSAYMRRIKSLVMEGLGDTRDQVRALAVEVNIFGENNESFSTEKRLVIRNSGAEGTNQRSGLGSRDQHSENLTNERPVCPEAAAQSEATVSYGDRSVTMRYQEKEGRILWM